MAESFDSGKDLRALNDDTIKQTLKTELEHLTASDALMRKTLEKCAAELDEKKEKRPLRDILFNRTSLRYCATVVATCLIVLAFLFNYPSLKGRESAKAAPGNRSMAGAQSADAAGGGAKPEASEAQSKNDNTMGLTSNSVAAPEASPAPAPAASAPAVEAPSADTHDQSFGVRFTEERGNGLSMLYSLNTDGSSKAQDNGLGSIAFGALTNAYNQANGTHYTSEPSEAISVSRVAKGGVSTQTLKDASSYHELLGTDSYWILPLENDQGAVSTLLPVFETEIADGSEYAYDISFRFSGETWMSSSYLGIPTDNPAILMMLDRKALEKTVQNAFNSGPATEVTIADICNGRDFMAFITADGKEYAVPLFSDSAIQTLVSGRAYKIRDAFDNLAMALESGN